MGTHDPSIPACVCEHGGQNGHRGTFRLVDTKKFTHQKDSAVTIVFDQPQYAEVRIPVKAFIRTEKVQRSPAGKADYRWAKDVAIGSLA